MTAEACLQGRFLVTREDYLFDSQQPLKSTELGVTSSRSGMQATALSRTTKFIISTFKQIYISDNRKSFKLNGTKKRIKDNRRKLVFNSITAVVIYNLS